MLEALFLFDATVAKLLTSFKTKGVGPVPLDGTRGDAAGAASLPWRVRS